MQKHHLLYQWPREISQPAIRALTGAGITTLTDLCRFSAEELLKLHGFGPKALRILTTELAKQNLSLKQ